VVFFFLYIKKTHDCCTIIAILSRSPLPIFELTVNEYSLFRWMPSVLSRSLRARCGGDEPRSRRWLVHHAQANAGLRERLGVGNGLAGQVFLLDGRGRVRWRGWGSPGPDDLDNFRAAVARLAAQRDDKRA
jgi:hypothetical protein